MPWIVCALAAAWWFEVWPFNPTYTYKPEVGYYQDGEQVWFVGSDVVDKEQCVSHAIAVYNNFNRESSRRAFSWACRKMQGDRFLDRVR